MTPISKHLFVAKEVETQLKWNSARVVITLSQLYNFCSGYSIRMIQLDESTSTAIMLGPYTIPLFLPHAQHACKNFKNTESSSLDVGL